MPIVRECVELLVLTIAYALVDSVIRQCKPLPTIRHVLGQILRAVQWLSIACLLASAAVWRWSIPAEEAFLPLMATGLGIMLSWKCATRDRDPVNESYQWPARIMVGLSAVGCWYSPALLLLLLAILSWVFGAWEHHATLPMRMLQAILAFSLCQTAISSLTGDTLLAATGVFFLCMMVASHYWITAFAKMWLGPRWYSWVTDNHTHHLAASAYSWGWARFVSWPTWLRVIRIIGRYERQLQAAVFTIELLAPLALLERRLAVACCIAWAMFHVGVLVIAGLLFWEWILTDLILASALIALPDHVTAAAFGGSRVVLGIAFMLAFPLRHRLWKPMPLGWWDTPLTQRMHWIVQGRSGTVYGVYNAFMCPYERLYGKVHGCFLTPVPVMTYHLGEVWKHELRDAIRTAGPNLERLETVRKRYGILPRDQRLEELHLRFLERFFAAVNRREPKAALPRWLSWLKAPGDQLYYWGERPAFRGQEEVTRIIVQFREEYFDGDQLVRLRDEPVVEIALRGDPGSDVSDGSQPGCMPAACLQPSGGEDCREPTPHEIDQLLLKYAQGRLIDLPGIAGGYVDSDDGRGASRAA